MNAARGSSKSRIEMVDIINAARGSSKSRIETISIVNQVLDKGVNVIKQIASEFPFGTDVVLDAYIQSGCSEQETRFILQKRLVEECLR